MARQKASSFIITFWPCNFVKIELAEATVTTEYLHIQMANLSNSIHYVHANGFDKGGYTFYPILIVGAGESGIAAGCRLKAKLGFDQFRIFDRQTGIGGTWWINKYPGVACDMYV